MSGLKNAKRSKFRAQGGFDENHVYIFRGASVGAFALKASIH